MISKLHPKFMAAINSGHERRKAISKDDVLNFKITLENSKDVLEVVAWMERP